MVKTQLRQIVLVQTNFPFTSYLAIKASLKIENEVKL